MDSVVRHYGALLKSMCVHDVYVYVYVCMCMCMHIYVCVVRLCVLRVCVVCVLCVVCVACVFIYLFLRYVSAPSSVGEKKKQTNT